MSGMIEHCVFCGQVVTEKTTKRTNADVIRAMSDEELAAALMCPNEFGMAEIVCAAADESDCKKCLRNWLQKEATEAGNAPKAPIAAGDYERAHKELSPEECRRFCGDFT